MSKKSLKFLKNVLRVVPGIRFMCARKFQSVVLANLSGFFLGLLLV